MAKGLTAQELYDAFYLEALSRARKKGDKLPTEVDVFKVLVKEAREAVFRGDESVEILDELAEVKSFHIREEEEARWKKERDEALREGRVLDLNDLL